MSNTFEVGAVLTPQKRFMYKQAFFSEGDVIIVLLRNALPPSSYAARGEPTSYVHWVYSKFGVHILNYRARQCCKLAPNKAAH